MLLVIGTVCLPARNLAVARPVMGRMAEASRAEEGCVEYGYAEDVFDPGLIHVKELWTDQAALDRHLHRSISRGGVQHGRSLASAIVTYASMTSGSRVAPDTLFDLSRLRSGGSIGSVIMDFHMIPISTERLLGRHMRG